MSEDVSEVAWLAVSWAVRHDSLVCEAGATFFIGKHRRHHRGRLRGSLGLQCLFLVFSLAGEGTQVLACSTFSARLLGRELLKGMLLTERAGTKVPTVWVSMQLRPGVGSAVHRLEGFLLRSVTFRNEVVRGCVLAWGDGRFAHPTPFSQPR